MHNLMFGMKRAHQSVLRICRPVLAPMGLTPARFDLLYALMGRPSGVDQTRLRKKLGVSRATVSRMLGSLEELGLVEREPHHYDRRQKVVKLTAKGREKIHQAHKDVVRSGWAQLAIDSALESTQKPWYSGPCWEAMDRLDRLLLQVREAYYDTGSLHYPCLEPDPLEDGPPDHKWKDGEGVV